MKIEKIFCQINVFSIIAILACGTMMGGAGVARGDTARSRQTFALVTDGAPAATLVVAGDLSSDARKAVDELVRYVRQSTGAELAVETVSVDGRPEIHIGSTDFATSLNATVDDLEIDGFRILFPAPDRVAIVGATPTGVEFAVYYFIERYVGVRWLFPGELGTHVPQAGAIELPTEEVKSVPRFMSRTISTMGGSDPGDEVHEWLQRHGRHWTIQHHHALDKIYPPAKYLKTNPEFYPLVDGKTVEPDQDAQNWQPMFEAPGVVDVAVRHITDYFNEYPGAISYSLGVNDGNNFGVPAKYKNSVGLDDYSDYYFNYANKVAEGVLKTHPDKWFGCLAYVGVTDPPREIKVNPRIIPHICIDRQGWAREDGRKSDMERTTKWHAAAPVLGWYDYIYGDDMYRIPRIYPHLMAEYLKFGAENGVKAYYAEHYASKAWIDGPKLYLTMQLLWDPDVEVDPILDEWYRLAVGEQAAVPLKQYYDFWEDYWTNRVTKTDWFDQNVGIVYFDFDQQGYLDELQADDLARCEKLLAEVVALAETPEQKARAAFMQKGFNDYRRQVDFVIRLRNKTLDPKSTAGLIFEEKLATGTGDQVQSPWAGWQNAPGTARIYVDRSTGFDDSSSFAIDARNAGSGVVIYRDLALDKPTAMHHLTARIRVDGVNPNANIGIEIRWQRPDGQYMPRKYTGNRYYSAHLYPDGEWKQLDVFAVPPTGMGPLTMRVTLSVIRAKEGTIRFDDIRLSTVDGGALRDKK